MAAYPLEIILCRQMAEHLALPVFITDPEGNLLYYNDYAEELLGERFEYTGPMPLSEWSVRFQPRNLEGELIQARELPLVQTLGLHRSAHSTFWIENLKGVRHLISVTSVPISGTDNAFFGAMAIFWKNEGP